MIETIICDDNAVILDELVHRTETAFASQNLKAHIHAFQDPAHITDAMLSQCDIALLDVDLESTALSGMDLARRLRAQRSDAVVIFVSNFIEYAPEGYEVQAFRYILKRDLARDLDACLRQALALLDDARKTVILHAGSETAELPLADILYLEVQHHTVTLYLQDARTGEISRRQFHAPLSGLEAQLAPHGFLRVHKSFLVNMQYISRFSCHEVVLKNGTQLRVSEKGYADNKRAYLHWRGTRV